MEVPHIVKLNHQKEITNQKHRIELNKNNYEPNKLNLKGKKTEKECWKLKCIEPKTKEKKNSCWKKQITEPKLKNTS